MKNSCDGLYSDFLDVRLTKACDNNCAFCIEKTGLNALKQDIPALIKSTIESGKTGVLILGGEPLLNIEAALQYIQGIRPHVDKIYLTTSLPHSIIDHPDIFQEIMVFLDGLNVSLQHYNPDINNQILNASNLFNRIELLKTILETWTHKIRVSINLVRGYIDNLNDLNAFLGLMKNIGCNHVKINELQNTDDLYVSYEKITGKKLKSPYAHGCQTQFKDENLLITLKRSCFLTSRHLHASFADLIKALFKRKSKPISCSVLYENGMLSSGWQKEPK